MRRADRWLAHFFLFFFLDAACAQSPQIESSTPRLSDKLISLGTGTEGGPFITIGAKICNLVNRQRKTHLLRCVPYRTPGSVYNARAVENGELVIGLTSSDLAYDESADLGVDADSNGDSLRAVMSLYPLPIMILARRATNITSLDKIAGHSINMGHVGSGQRSIVNFVLHSIGLTTANFSSTRELSRTGVGDAFCKGEVDIVIEALGNPALFYRRLIEQCDAVIVPIPPQIIERMIESQSMFDSQVIPGGLYRGYPDDIPSIGSRVLLVANKKTSAQTISSFAATLVSRLFELQTSDQVMQDLDPEKMFSQNIPIPLHAGITSYLQTRNAKAPNAQTIPPQK